MKCFPQVPHVQYSSFPSAMQAASFFGVCVRLPCFTVTEQVSVKLPSTVLTVIVAVPALTAVTLPLVSTVAISLLLLSPVTARLSALAGSTVAVRVSVLPSVRFNVLVFSDTPVTETVAAGLMVMLNCSLSEPPLFVAFTVKLYVPAVVGLPEMVPVLSFKVRPFGKVLPVEALHVHKVGLPIAASVALYAVPTVPSVRGEVVVMLGGAVP